MADLAGILGADRVTELDGLPVVTPHDADEVATLLASASRDRLALVVRGGGTKARWRPAPARCDAILSTAALSGIVDHQPGDMTLVAQAGTPLAAVQELVTGTASHRQRLMLDGVGGPESTLGGILSTRAAGPRRHLYGTPRDIVIGARFVTGDGVVAKTGGTVVKNVAGYDVAKLLIGAHGSLALITEVAVKLHPVPEASRTVLMRSSDAAAVTTFLEHVRTAPVTPTAVEIRWPEGLVAVRIGSTAAGAEAQVALLRAFAELELLDEPAGDALLDEHLAFPFMGSGAVLGVGVRPSDLVALLDVVDRAGAAFVGRAALVAGDIVFPDADPARVMQVADAIRALGGTVQPRGDATLASSTPAGIARLETAMREALDPVGVLA